MPIPKPKKGEAKDKFISRCMDSKPMQEYEQTQRAGICFNQWKRGKKKMNAQNQEVATGEMYTDGEN